MNCCAALRAPAPGFVNLEDLTDEELGHVQREFARLREKYAPLVDDDLAHVQREISARASAGKIRCQP